MLHESLFELKRTLVKLVIYNSENQFMIAFPLLSKNLNSLEMPQKYKNQERINGASEPFKTENCLAVFEKYRKSLKTTVQLLTHVADCIYGRYLSFIIISRVSWNYDPTKK